MAENTGVTDLDEFGTPEEWTNYGDANPRIHGGRWVRWEDDHWHLIETRDLKEAGPEGMIQDGERYMIEDYVIYPDDVFAGGEPKNGLTDAMKGVLDSLSDTGYDPDEYPEEPTEYAPEFAENIAYYVVDIPFHTGIHGRDEYTADYWDYLERNYGIEQE